MSEMEVLGKLDNLFREWSARLHKEDPRTLHSYIIHFASEHYEHAGLIVNRIVRQVEMNSVSKFDQISFYH